MAYKLIIWHGTEFELPEFPEKEVLVIKFNPHDEDYRFVIPDNAEIDASTSYVLHVHGGRKVGTDDEDNPVHDTLSNGFVVGGTKNLEKYFFSEIRLQHKEINNTDMGPALHLAACFATHAAKATAETLDTYNDGTTVYLQSGFKEVKLEQINNMLQHIVKSHSSTTSTMQSRFDAFHQQLSALPSSVTLVQGTRHAEDALFGSSSNQEETCCSVILSRIFNKASPIQSYNSDLEKKWHELNDTASEFARIHGVKLSPTISIDNIVDFDSKVESVGKEKSDELKIKYLLEHAKQPSDFLFIIGEISCSGLSNIKELMTAAISHPLFDTKAVLSDFNSKPELLSFFRNCDKSHPSTMKLACAILKDSEFLQQGQTIPIRSKALGLVSSQQWSKELIDTMTDQLESILPEAFNDIIDQLTKHPNLSAMTSFLDKADKINTKNPKSLQVFKERVRKLKTSQEKFIGSESSDRTDARLYGAKL